MSAAGVSERAVVLAPRGRDAVLASAMLAEAGLDAQACGAVSDLVTELARGVGFVVVTEEAVATADLHALSAWIDGQEEWSDLPFILLTTRGGGIERNPAAARYLDILGNVTFLERPFHPTTLVSLARSAVRARRRQYDARSRLVELRDSETRFRTLFDTMDEGFCVIQFLDGPHGSFSDYVHVQANPAYARHAGIPDVVGRRVRDMVPDEAGEWVELYRRVLLTGEPTRFERELVATGRHLDLAAFRVEPAERREVAVIFQDITARVRAEMRLRELNETLERRVEDAVAARETAQAQLHQAQKLETIGQLTGGVAHDFNNLLTPIMGALDLLHKHHTGDARSARLLSGALQSAERAKTLVQRLLGFARRQALETRPVDLAELVHSMRDLVTSSVGSGHALVVDVPAGLPHAMVDANQLELAILNLCVNARDAMPTGGEVTVRLREEPVASGGPEGLPPGRYLRLDICDTGVGMDPETLRRAVEPFYSTKGVGKGTGLGLSMVHGLAAQLGGAFVLTSEPGRGTQASIYLPEAASAAAPSDRKAAAGGDAGRPLSILLVDDEDVVRAATAEMLRDLGHRVHQASGGAEALSVLADGVHVDAVVTDYMMPRMDGAQLAAVIHRQHGDRLPILIVTGYAGGGFEIGWPQLSKPFRAEDLAASLSGLTQTGPSAHAAAASLRD